MDSATIETIKSLGFPIAVALSIGFAFWRVLVWVADRIVVPMMENLKEMTNTNQRIARSLEKIEDNGTNQMKMQNEQMKVLDHLSERISKLEVTAGNCSK